MKPFSIIADPRIQDDLKEVRDFLNSRREGYGKNFLSEYKQLLKILEKNPLFQVRYNEVRCLPFKTFKYMIHFKVDESEKRVHLFAILSTHLNPDKQWL